MLAIAVQKINASYDLIQNANEYVLAVPGADLVNETMYCGTETLKDVDKVKELRIDLLPSEHIGVPGLQKAIANVEMVKVQSVRVGDHIIVIGQAVAFRVNRALKTFPLVSIGPDTTGYNVLAQKGIHRIGTVDQH